MAELQEKLFAQGRFGSPKRLLLILQAMDTAGKGGIVSHVVGAMDPQGVQLRAFKAPTDEEKSHDFLWRIENNFPPPEWWGFDRSHYEDVLIHRVHGWADASELERRYAAINDFEARLATSGTTIVKVMLNISKDEQKRNGLSPAWTTQQTLEVQQRGPCRTCVLDDYMDAYGGFRENVNRYSTLARGSGKQEVVCAHRRATAAAGCP